LFLSQLWLPFLAYGKTKLFFRLLKNCIKKNEMDFVNLLNRKRTIKYIFFK
jgi:hypothetical protein